MFTRSAQFYDAIYSFKDYAAEAARIHEVVTAQLRAPGNDLLDVGCGTGRHLVHLRDHYRVEGVDLDAELLALARAANPGAVFHRADMRDLELGREFDVVTCLFSTLGYARTVEAMQRTVARLSRHLRQGGVLLIEPWFTPEEYEPGFLAARFIDEAELKLARINRAEVYGRVSILDFHYLVGTPAGVESFRERHELGLFTHAEHLAALEACGLETTYDAEGLSGRGLYIAVRR
jgi:SAM-dependent methyltransferase